MHVFGQRIYARIQTLLAADIHFGLRSDYTALTQREFFVGHQTPTGGAAGRQIFNTAVLFRVEMDIHIALISRHGGERLFRQVQ